jgi:hypothetical protein
LIASACARFKPRDPTLLPSGFVVGFAKTFGDLIRLHPRHVENVSERVKATALGKHGQFLGYRGDIGGYIVGSADKKPGFSGIIATAASSAAGKFMAKPIGH